MAAIMYSLQILCLSSNLNVFSQFFETTCISIRSGEYLLYKWSSGILCEVTTLKLQSTEAKKMSKAIVQESVNKEDVLSTLKIVTRPIPKAAAGQVVVRVTMRPINPTDFISLRGGLIPANGILGSEGVGVVHEVGEDVTEFKKGQRVVPITALEVFKGNGSWQEYICLEVHLVWPVPDGMSDEVAAQFVINPFTSVSMLKDLEVPAGEYVLQSAAGSVLGKQVIQLAKHWGLKTINIVRRPEQKEELKALGADEVICSSEEDIEARVKQITGGKGAWGALDPVLGTMTQSLASSVRDKGKVFVYGLLSGNTLTFNFFDLYRGVSLQVWALYDFILSSPEKTHACAAEVAELLKDGVISTGKCKKYNLAEFKEAVKKAEESGSGKLLLVSM